MKGFLIGAVVTAILLGAALAALVAMAEAGAPDPEEIRIEVSDDDLGRS